MDAEKLILEYYTIRKEMIELTKHIKNDYINDTKPADSFNYSGTRIETIYQSNHLNDYFEYGKDCRSRANVDGAAEGDNMEFADYCCDVLGMEEPCERCANMLEMIRKRRALRVKLGHTKNKIMNLGKALEKLSG